MTDNIALKEQFLLRSFGFSICSLQIQNPPLLFRQPALIACLHRKCFNRVFQLAISRDNPADYKGCTAACVLLTLHAHKILKSSHPRETTQSRIYFTFKPVLSQLLNAVVQHLRRTAAFSLTASQQASQLHWQTICSKQVCLFWRVTT